MINVLLLPIVADLVAVNIVVAVYIVAPLSLSFSLVG